MHKSYYVSLMWDELLVYLYKCVAASSIVQTWKVCDLNVISLVCITYDNRIVFLVCCVGCIWIIGWKSWAQVGKCYSYCSSFLQWISLLCFSFKIFLCLNYPSAFPVLVSWCQKFYLLQIFKMLLTDSMCKIISGSWFERIDKQEAHENSVEMDEREAEA